jgi:hypothetical protein
VTDTSLLALPEPEYINDEASASSAPCRTLAVVATTNHQLAAAPVSYEPDGLRQDLEVFHERLTGLFRELHELLPKIASFRADITGWSVTVGMSNDLTVNFVNKNGQD